MKYFITDIAMFLFTWADKIADILCVLLSMWLMLSFGVEDTSPGPDYLKILWQF